MKAIRRQRVSNLGFSLIELLVCMAIGLILTLAISKVLKESEGTRRGTTSTNDANQTGAYVTYLLDRAIRSAGSGYMQNHEQISGCSINASFAGNPILPRPAPLPAPFGAFLGLPGVLHLAPVIITKGAAPTDSDILTILTGTSGRGESAIEVDFGSVKPDYVELYNTFGFEGHDLVMVAEDSIGCMVQQVIPGFIAGAGKQLTFLGDYYHPTGFNVSLVDFDLSGNGNAFVIPLGNALKNPPMFQAFGVDATTNTLVSYDFLQKDNDIVPVADGVVQMRALYGIDSNDDGKLDIWADPGVAPWNRATLLAPTSTTIKEDLLNIVAVRIGLILRTSTIERRVVAPTSIKLFSDLGAPLEQTIPVANTNIRHRAIEVTVPLRNVLLHQPTP